MHTSPQAPLPPPASPGVLATVATSRGGALSRSATSTIRLRDSVRFAGTAVHAETEWGPSALSVGAAGTADTAGAAAAALVGALILRRPDEQVAQAPSAQPSPLKLTRPRTTSPLDPLSESADDDEVGEEGAPKPLPRDKPLVDRSAMSTGQSPSVADRIASYRPGCTTAGSCVRGGSGEAVPLACARGRRWPRIIAFTVAGAGDAGGSCSDMPFAPITSHPRFAAAASTTPATAVADATGGLPSSASPRRRRDRRHRDAALGASMVARRKAAPLPALMRCSSQLLAPPTAARRSVPWRSHHARRADPPRSHWDARGGEGRSERLPRGSEQPAPPCHDPADDPPERIEEPDAPSRTLHVATVCSSVKPPTDRQARCP